MRSGPTPMTSAQHFISSLQTVTELGALDFLRHPKSEAQRIHDPQMLTEKAKAWGVPPASIQWGPHSMAFSILFNPFHAFSMHLLEVLH